MRKLYVTRERALACFALPYHCVLGQTAEEHLRWAAAQDREELMRSRGPGTMRNGETVCLPLEEGAATLFVIAYREQGELISPTVELPAGTEDLRYAVVTEFDGDRRLSLTLRPGSA